MTPEEIAARSETIFDAFRLTAAANPGKPFLIVPGREGRAYAAEGVTLTYGAALSEVERRASLFAAKGYGPGHRVALALENRPEHVLTQLALYAVGASQVPVNPDYREHELAYLAEHSEACLAIGLPHNLARLAPLLPAVLEVEDIPPAPAPAKPGSGRATEAAVIYTSGTTGRPKGCLIDHEYHFAVGLWYAGLGHALTLRIGEERLYVPLPVFHVNAGINTLSAVILTANALIMPDRFHPDAFWREVAETGATGLHYLGAIPPILMKRSPEPAEKGHRLRFGLGAGLDPALHAAFEARFGLPMVEVWGMSETGRFLADHEEPRRIRTRAFGRPRAPLEAIVADEAGREVPRGEAGELLVRAAGPDLRHGFFRGYLKDEAATEEAWRGGWLHTGDVVFQEPDGMLHFVERRKNIIRRSGENVSAAEVEDALIGSGLVRGVAVIGVPDEVRDEEIMACVIPEGPRDEAAARAIFAHARERLAYHKAPGWLAFVDALPRTGTEKVRKGLIFPEGADPRDFAYDLRALKKREG
ncbi:MAG: AMP-binding protein [Pikeienuella sp.]|uniref:AMP-binding protein n=1 Tax=Pikeienuella sp. TaxID=2831957 RepID=UPI00391978D5